MQSDPPGNVNFIHPMSCKPLFSKDKVLQYLVNKCQITYPNIWGKSVQTLFSGIGLSKFWSAKFKTFPTQIRFLGLQVHEKESQK